MKRRQDQAADLERRLAALGRAVDLADDRLDASAVEGARVVVGRAGQRVGLGLGATVIALLGPTGAGKSSLFNALAGQELVTAGVRRPTTSTATAAIWGEAPDALLDWLEVPRRHVVGVEPDGLVLLDLPDFDSVEAANRSEVDRLVGVVDLLVWVVDPQKYADGALHDGYLRPLAGHRDVMMVVLNQADRLTPDEVAGVRRNLGELLAEEGLAGLDVVPASALTGLGVEELRALLGRRVQARADVLARLSADVTRAAAPLAAGCGDGSGAVTRATRQQLVSALAEAAGVPATVAAVEGAHRRRGALETGWPVTRWVRRLRPDPLKRLRLPDRPKDDGGRRPHLPPPPHRRAADAGRRRRPRPRRRGGPRAAAAVARPRPPRRHPLGGPGRRPPGSRSRLRRPAHDPPGLVGRCRLAPARLRPGRPRRPGLARRGRAARLPAPRRRRAHAGGPRLPHPDPPALGGLLAGLLLALLARFVNRAAARRRARRAERALHQAVDDAADELVVGPVEAELAARRELCEAVTAARGT